MTNRPTLSPDQIRQARFSGVGRRGVDKGEVAAFLERVADAYAHLLEQVERAGSPPTFEQLGSEAAALLAAANDGADSIRAGARQEAEEIRRKVTEEAEAIRAQARRDVAALHEEAKETRAKAKEEAAGILQEAAANAERSTKEAELVARRLRNVTERQCNEMLAETNGRRERLEAHEREIRRRIEEVERVFQGFRAEMEAMSERPDEPADTLSVSGGGDEEQSSPVRVQVESVQPKPIFEGKTRR